MDTGTDLLIGIIIAVVMLLVGLGVGLAVGRRSSASRGGDGKGRDRRVDLAGGAQDLTPMTSADEDSGQETVVPPKPRVAIIVNPSKPDAAGLEATAGAVCRQEGWDAPIMFETEVEDPGCTMARQALEQQVDLVVAAGGDGTVRAVAEVLAGTGVPMGVVPMGTGNLLARNLDIVLGRPEWALRIALWGEDTAVDVAHAQIEPGGKDHAFMVMAGLGFDAAVMADTDSDLKSKVGWLAYLEAGSRKLVGTRTKVRVTVDGGEPFTEKIRSVVAGNCGKLQGGITLLPEAELDDGILDVIVIAPKNAVQWIGVAASVLGRNKRKGLHTEIHRCREIIIESEEEIEVQLDGDAVGSSTYLAMQVEEHALTMRTATRQQKRAIRAEGWPIPVG
ncbi:diacylglycerol kinase family protein [uncultured Brevibacterium sp.]|uniref:diacylglycerol/lipid kinase family protein n=1 Tax=uncultured Brevibacterium sp. TaxID=189678 RepID=UPI0025EF18E9|nr:diacylglycerol kinase family protein [uncultured Brevibacterium sp.]